MEKLPKRIGHIFVLLCQGFPDVPKSEIEDILSNIANNHSTGDFREIFEDCVKELSTTSNSAS